MTDHLEPLLLGEGDYGLATDLYQITMMASYRARADLSPQATSTFELFVRRLPKGRAFLVAAGLEQSLAYLRDLRFSDEDVAYLKGLSVFGSTDPAFFEWLRAFRFEGDVDAIPEGTLVLPNEPLVRIHAPLAQAQLVETFLLATINAQTLIASKAARVRMASQGRTFVDFGARRAHGFAAAMLATRAAWIAGADGTSNVVAAKKLGIPVLGTAAHAFIMSFEREQDAFRAYHEGYPDHCVLLIDTYDTHEGCRRATAIGPSLKGVRLDSGDLGQLAKDCRAILDGAGLTATRIVASGDLNEDKITALLADGAPIDSFGVGTELVTSRDQPALGGVYKLVERADGDTRIPVMKLAEGKITWPGPKQVWRHHDADGTWSHDVIELADAPAPADGVPLLRPVMRGGALLPEAFDSLDAMRARCAEGLRTLPNGLRALHDYAEPPVRIGPALAAMAEELKGTLT
ncbi:MAG: nicotinate phosphoribosyltransferase [Sandaracinaceae bacterium]|nr:nicotinate phosphoribosyltransferase [Sandaracinaceae bacterium]